MRPDPACEQMVAVQHQMMGGDRPRDPRAPALHIGDALGGRDMLEHDAQPRQAPAQGFEDAVDKDRLAVEDVDLGVGHLAMDAKRHARLGHARKHPLDARQIAHARGRIGRGARGIELDRLHDPRRMGRDDILGLRRLGQIERHERPEIRPRGQRREDAVAIGHRIRARHHRRHEVRHDEGAAEMARAFGQHGCEHRTVAQMQMQIVGARDGQSLGHGAS